MKVVKDFLLTDEIIFDSKPDAVPYNYRISYKVSQICLIISMGCNAKSGCSLVKLHILANSLKTEEDIRNLLDYLSNRKAYIIVRFDPAMNRAIKYAISDELIFQLKNGTFKLTEKGKNLVQKINKDEILLSREKEYLKKIGTRLTNEKIETLMSAWRYQNVESKSNSN